MANDYRGYLTPECSSCPYWSDGSTWDLGCTYTKQCEHTKPTQIEEKPQHRYSYNGPVMIFDQCITNLWYGETKAVSERKAKANLLFRWKKEHGFAPDAKASLPGQVKIMG